MSFASIKSRLGQTSVRQRVAWGAALCLLGGAITYFLWDGRPYHFKTVREGVLYRCGTLDASVLEEVIVQYGIKTVVNLRHDRDQWAYDAEKRTTERLGAKFQDMPLLPITPPNDNELRAWLELMDDPNRLPILAHCEHGVTRTSMFTAVYLIEKEYGENRHVLENLESFGHDKWAEHYQPFRDFVLNYVPRSKKRSALPNRSPRESPESQ